MGSKKKQNSSSTSELHCCNARSEKPRRGENIRASRDSSDCTISCHHTAFTRLVWKKWELCKMCPSGTKKVLFLKMHQRVSHFGKTKQNKSIGEPSTYCFCFFFAGLIAGSSSSSSSSSPSSSSDKSESSTCVAEKIRRKSQLTMLHRIPVPPSRLRVRDSALKCSVILFHIERTKD